MFKAQRIGKSVIIGAVSGLAASWVMNQYWAAEAKLKEQFQPAEGEAGGEQQGDSANATAKMADTISRAVAGRDIQGSKKSSPALSFTMDLAQPWVRSMDC